MPIRNYGVLKARVVEGRAERHHRTPHYQLLTLAAGVRFRVAVDTRSREDAHPDLLYACHEDFRHPLLEPLSALADGFHPLHAGHPLALDYQRGGLVSPAEMQPLAGNLPGPDNDLNEKVDRWVRLAHADAPSRVYAFGGRWGPEDDRPDAIFQFRPGNGVHDVHLNQGNPPGRHARDNGAWQDGALFFHLASQQRWVAIFLAFQSQRWGVEGA